MVVQFPDAPSVGMLMGDLDEMGFLSGEDYEYAGVYSLIVFEEFAESLALMKLVAAYGGQIWWDG